ncbi:dolichol monophosphate mannose synthase [Salmonella enterica subsp. enterica serovar Havana]|nr:dolichol monophosphate mannose synthase [Salmonella enterica]EBX0470820.1 dolichol monophosphate mannose synthase [Salmonella enterica subsp. enterica serovar Havana]EBX8404734.1 dolichol monophosphate mannose synthase [Salmonella enterica subsp. enterica serovar Oranienburg]EAW1071578.1 dolichol monophosphate mannose synthase [Salmonella enterica]EAY1111208.1 dolichol monophosphate mannose synthase [Salmonella enterica]
MKGTGLEENILVHMCENKNKKTWTTQEIVSVFGMSSYQARYYLTQLCRHKKLIRSPLSRGSSTYWMLSEHKSELDVLPEEKNRYE